LGRSGLLQTKTPPDKILKGAQPGDLPIRTVLKHELVVNLRTAYALGVTIPEDLIKRADLLMQ
jgi:putative ABC transport system substrate-binding protein